MIHIRYIASSRLPNHVYSVVVTSDWNAPIEDHPSIVEHPDLFELVDEDIPEHAEYLNYVSS